MANVTKTLVAAMTPTQVANSALGALVGNLFLAKVADRNWEPMFAKFGETVNVPVRGAVVANNKVADAQVTLQAPAATAVSIVLNNHKEFSALFEDVAKAFANQDVIAGYATDAAVVIAETIEVAGFVEAYTNFTVNTPIGAQQVDATDELVLTARKTLRDAKVPVGQALYLFLSTKDMLGLLQLPQYRDAEKLGDGGARQENAPMQFQKYGMTFVESQYVQKVTQLTHCLGVAPKQGLALAMRPLPLPPGGVISADVVGGPPESASAGLGLRMIQAYRPEYLSTQLTVDALFGWKVIRGAFGVDVQT